MSSFGPPVSTFFSFAVTLPQITPKVGLTADGAFRKSFLVQTYYRNFFFLSLTGCDKLLLPRVPLQ